MGGKHEDGRVGLKTFLFVSTVMQSYLFFVRFCSAYLGSVVFSSFFRSCHCMYSDVLFS